MSLKFFTKLKNVDFLFLAWFSFLVLAAFFGDSIFLFAFASSLKQDDLLTVTYMGEAATEEGIELLGDTLMLIGAIEFVLYYFVQHRNMVQ